jgi:hypothetical protein
LAAKTALSLRYDALIGLTTRSGDSANVEMEDAEMDGPTVGIKYREKVEHRLRLLENRLEGTTPLRNGARQQKKFEFKAYLTYAGFTDCRAPSYNADADVPMTEADLSPLLSTTPDGKKDKKEKKEKKEKKRSRKEMEEEEEEAEEKVVEQSKSNGVEESASTKKEKSKSKKDKV